MNHLIITRMCFEDKSLLNHYINITKNILVQCLIGQTNKNFKLGIFLKEEDEILFRKELKYPFIPFYGYKVENGKHIVGDQFSKYIIDNNVNIQTRHDCDDFMADNYVEIIQNTYLKEIETFDKFIIHFQPTRLDYATNKEYKARNYTHNAISMFLSLCQKNAVEHVFARQHTAMRGNSKKVIKFPEGYVKWVAHGKNIMNRINKKEVPINEISSPPAGQEEFLCINNRRPSPF